MTLIVCDGTAKLKYTVTGSQAQLARQPLPFGCYGVTVTDAQAPGGNISGLTVTVVNGVAAAAPKA